jgi:formate dehydrogenase subunit beta
MDEQNTLINELRQITGSMLSEAKVVGILGMRDEHGHIGPHLFTTLDELTGLILAPHYPLASLSRGILASVESGRLGVVVRGCDERAFIELTKLEQVSMERLEFIGVACTEDQAEQCGCARPYPQRIDIGLKVEGFPRARQKDVQDLMERNTEERLAFWRQEFDRCIKCYGCRNVCPVCVCEVCVLGEDCWVERGQIPPELPFHLIRAFHIADKCVGCGACEATCPVEIPLTLFYSLLRERLFDLFEYEPGMDETQTSPLTTTLDEVPLAGL